jgi:Flp pilus assembly pilin Flp
MRIFKNFIKDERGTAEEGLALIAVFAIIFIVITINNSYIDNKMFGGKRYFETKEYIISLEDNLALSDSPFVLGIGSIDQNIYYFVRVVKSENPLRTTVYKLPASKWDLIEEDNLDKPYLYKKVEKYYNLLAGGVVEKPLEQYIVVPKGTIKKTFNSDLK